MSWWLVLLLIAGLIEYLAWRNGGTLSQRFWQFQRPHPWVRWVMVGLLALLAVHLGWEWP